MNHKENYDYTISIFIGSEELIFRDLCGKDLEYIEYILGDSDKISFSKMCLIIKYLYLGKKNILSLPARKIPRIFEIIQEKILCNFMPKVTWLEYCYAIQNSSFSNLESMEFQPLNKFRVMCDIHERAIEYQKSTVEG